MTAIIYISSCSSFTSIPAIKYPDKKSDWVMGFFSFIISGNKRSLQRNYSSSSLRQLVTSHSQSRAERNIFASAACQPPAHLKLSAILHFGVKPKYHPHSEMVPPTFRVVSLFKLTIKIVLQRYTHRLA